MGKMKLAYVEWKDSKQPSSGWEYLSELDLEQPCHIQSVGWLHTRNDEVVVLLPNLGHGSKTGEVNQACGALIIPRAAITKIKILADPIRSRVHRVHAAVRKINRDSGNSKRVKIARGEALSQRKKT
ncbi:hypothetical protein LCGC14_2742770 [marine sediment metagenome]|uniref:Uncharacterized protein n=1 Tax=marine sediment metagenome TaxID=412755 RepID=A0A0F8Z415_9ZZZZ